MVNALDLKNVVEGIVSSYEKRVESVGLIFDAADQVLNDFHETILDTKEEREKIGIQLRDVLTRNEHLRKKDFDTMMRGILQVQAGREKEARSALKGYLKEHESMALALKENFEKLRISIAGGEVERVKEFQALNREILARQEERKGEITSKLKEFQKEQQDLAVGLRELLARGNALRIKDLKLMLKRFKARKEERSAEQRKRKEEVAEMLSRFKKERQRVFSTSATVKIDGCSKQKKQA